MLNVRVNENSEGGRITPSTIGGVNLLPYAEKREIYARIIPPKLREHFQVPHRLFDENGNDLLILNCPPGSYVAEISFFHRHLAEDPVMYGQMTDTLNGQILVLFYAISDPESPRFNVDKMPDGTMTKFGTICRNIEAEIAALEAGLAPAQIRRGLRMLAESIAAFEMFAKSLGHTLFFAEPLHYHSAVILERHGFDYQQGRRLMERIQSGFAPGGDLILKLDGSTPFRQPDAANSLRLRSWAIHDGILDEPFTNITMYKIIGKQTQTRTCPNIPW